MSARDEEPWVKIEPLDVAIVAATLMHDGMDVADATRTAMRLIDAASFALAGMYERGEVADGVNSWADQEAVRREREKYEEKLGPKWPDPALSSMSLDRALSRLMPRLKKIDRLVKFRRWLAHVYRVDLVEAGEMIANLKEEGITQFDYTVARVGIVDWMEGEKSKQRSAAGKRGARSKKRSGKK